MHEKDIDIFPKRGDHNANRTKKHDNKEQGMKRNASY